MPSARIVLTQGWNPQLLRCGRFFTAEPPGKPQEHIYMYICPSSQSYGFPVVMYGCESWTVMKAEHRRIHAFELWCWRRLLRVPWTTRRSNQSILKEISPEYSSEGLMLKLKLQYFGHQMQRTESFEKTLMLGKIEGRRRRGRQRMRWLDGITDSMAMSLGKLRAGPILILSSAAHASLPSPCLLVVGAGICTASPLGELPLGS